MRFTFPPGFPNINRMLATYAKHQLDILRVCSVLPGYRYAQVKAAINASGAHPQEIYESLCMDNETTALILFYAALRELKP